MSSSGRVETKHLDIDKIKGASFEIGKAAGQAVNAVEAFANDEKVKGTLADLKTQAMDRYKKETGRSASIDGTILKYAAVGSAGIVGMSVLPSMVVGGALGMGAVALVQSQLDKATEVISEATGRDAEKDKKLVKEVSNEVPGALKEATASIKQGFQSTRKTQPANNNK